MCFKKRKLIGLVFLFPLFYFFRLRLYNIYLVICVNLDNNIIIMYYVYELE